MANISGTRSERINMAYATLPEGKITKARAILNLSAVMGITQKLAIEYIDMLIVQGRVENNGWEIWKKE